MEYYLRKKVLDSVLRISLSLRILGTHSTHILGNRNNWHGQ